MLLCQAALAGNVQFVTKPKVVRAGGATQVSFAVSTNTDVEVAVLDADGKVVRHLAAGVLGGAKPPPAPLVPGLAQTLSWDGKDDFGALTPDTRHPAPFSVRVRAGTGVKFDRFVGADPFNFGAIDGIATDEDGNLYLKGYGGEANQCAMTVRVFDPEGRYLREILPFPASLPPDAVQDFGRWDPDRKTFFPRNLKSLNPDFYTGGNLTLVSASKKNGVVFTDGRMIYTIGADGRALGPAFATRDLGAVGNTGGGPVFLAISPDAKYACVSGPFSSDTQYGHKIDTNFPPGRVYRAALAGNERLKPFVTVPVAHSNGIGGAWLKACFNTGNFTAPKGPVHQSAFDASGNLYVADREHGCVAVFDAEGRELGRVAIKNPHLVAVHPKTGAIYVTQFDCLAYGTFQCVLNKFDSYAAGATPAATYQVPPGANTGQAMALSVGKDKTTVWIAGIKGGLLALEDRGATFEPLKIAFAKKDNLPVDWNRLATDYDRDEIYISNGVTKMWRYDGKTGEGGLLRKNGRDFLVNDVAVGYDGLLYTRVSGAWNGSAPEYSGPYWRLDRNLDPAPFPGGTNYVLSPYIYSRYGIGFAERGLGVGPDGKSYIAFMYDWVAYAIGGFGPDGKPLKGKYLEGVFPAKKADERKKYATGWDSAIIGPVPQGTANIRVDLQGNIYVGMFHRPKGVTPPKGFEKDQAYRVSVGSVIKFGPEGGRMTGSEGAMAAEQLEGALEVYPGLAPFSNNFEGFGRNTCCVCRVPRFDLDRYGRLSVPNAMTCSVLLYDNAGNLIAEIGQYGNFDSQYINPDTAAGKANAPTVATPDIPLAWPTGAAFTEDRLYLNDTYNRRVVRTKFTYQAEESCAVK
jgi:sugar lactone lactonase YvrE